MIIQNKGKDISKKKNTTGLIQVRLGIVKKEKNEKFSEILISMQNYIICNTHKMYFSKLISTLYNL